MIATTINRIAHSLALATLAVCCLVAPAHAATYTWDNNAGTAPNPQDGSGNWDTTTANWWTGATNTTWNNATPDSAIIGAAGTAGTITLTTGITADDITFEAVTGNYTVTSNTLTLSGTPTIAVNDDASTIGSAIAGSAGLTKSGTGTLLLTNTNSYSGTTTINAGMLQVGNNSIGVAAINNSPTVSIASGATFRFFRGDTSQLTLLNTFTSQTPGAGTIRLSGAGTTDVASQWTTAQNNNGFTGNWVLDGARLNVDAVNDLGSGSTVEVQANGQLLVNGAITIGNNITVTDSSGWRDGGFRLGAIRLEGNSNLSGNITLNQSTGVIFGDGTGLNSTISAYSLGTHTLSGVISGTGEFSMSRYTAWNGGTATDADIILAGSSSNTYTGKTIVNGQHARADLWLSKTGGAVAINGGTTVQMGNNTGGQANLRMGGNEQFGTNNGGVLMNFVNATGQWMRFDLKGTTQTLAGITGGTTSTQAGAVIQNQGIDGVVPAGDATLTLNGSGTYLYNGIIRDQDNGGTTRKLSLVKSGTGTQTLVGNAITYTGLTTVNGGSLVFSKTGALNTSIANAATVGIDSVSGDDWTLLNGNTLSGAGTWIKTGAGRATFANTTLTTSGQFLIQDGTLRNNNNSSNWSGSTADIDISSTGILDLYADAIYVDQLTGTGIVQNNYGNSSGQSGSSAFIEKLVVGVANGSSTFNGVIRNNSAGTAPASATAGGGIQLEKTGSGTFTLAGANTYSGGSTVSQGTLRTTNTAGFGTGAVTMGDAGTGANNIQLTLAANNIANNIIVSNNGTGTATIFGETQFNGHNGTIALNRATTFQIPNSGTGDWWYAFGGGGISGAGPVTIKGGGGATTAAAAGNRVVFNGNNSYSGGTTIESGMLQLGHVNAAGTGNITLGNASSGSAVTQLRVGANIANNIIVSAAAPGSAASIGTYNALQTLSGGLQVNRALTINGGGDRLTWSGPLAVWSGAGEFTISGGRVTHDGVANTWTGNMTINAGSTFQPGHASTLTAANSVTANGTLQLNNVSQTINGLSGSGNVQNIIGANTLTVGAGNATSTFSGTMQNGSGALSLTKAGSGTFTLSGIGKSYTGTTNVNAGVLEIQNVGNGSGDGFRSPIVNGAQVWLTATTGQTSDHRANISGTGSLTKKGPGIVRIGTWSGLPVLTYSGGTTVEQGILDLQGQVAGRGFDTTGGLSINPGAEFRLSGLAAQTAANAARFGALSGSGTVRGAFGTPFLEIGNGGGTGAFSGQITNNAGVPLSLIKSGSGTQVLSGNNNYSGTTTVSAGELIVDGVHSGAGNYLVASGARLGGNGTIDVGNNAITISSSPGAISPGNAGYLPSVNEPLGSHAEGFSYSAGLDPNTVGVLDVVGDLTIGGYLLIDITDPLVDLLRVDGDVTLGSSSLIEMNGLVDLTELNLTELGFEMGDFIPLLTADEITGNFANFPANQQIVTDGGNVFFGNDGSTIFLQLVPEPVSWLMWLVVAVSVAGVGYYRHRRP